MDLQEKAKAVQEAQKEFRDAVSKANSEYQEGMKEIEKKHEAMLRLARDILNEKMKELTG